MSLLIAADLLRQYNKKSPYQRTAPIASRADEDVKLGTWSYANKYDALYDKYSQNKNFNIKMWQDAIKVGEQDQYLAFLEQNKNNTLSSQFYDPQYYDYESMMLELYLPFANAANTDEMRTTEFFDEITGKWVTQELGPMSDRDYIQYQLNINRDAKAAEISRQLEYERKEQTGFWRKLGADIAATGMELGEGIISALAGLLDLGIATGSFGLIPRALDDGEGNYLDSFVNYFGYKGLTAAERKFVRDKLDEYEREHTHFRDADGNITGSGTYVAGIANSIGMMVPAIVANAFTGGATSLAWVGPATFYSSIFSSNIYENATNPNTANSPSWLKISNAAIKTGAEIVVEKMLGVMLGGTIQNTLIGTGGRTLSEGFINAFGKYAGIKYVAKSALQEGLEEFMQDFSTNLVDQFTDLLYEGYGNNGVTFQTLVDSFFAGVLSSLVMSGGAIGLEGLKTRGINRAAEKAAKRAAEKAGEPYKKLDFGPGDTLIETENGIEKVTGANKLYYSSILRDFKNAVYELKKGKITLNKNIELAQEVYGALSALTQFYSSFDTTRIKNIELLLDRVVKAENAKIARTENKTLAEEIETTFKSMVGDVAARHAKRVAEATKKISEKLEDAGVTEITNAIDIDGTKYKKDPAMAELEERLGKPAMDKLDILKRDKEYDWVFTTDGHIAIEEDKMLFVSESWLQNYEISEIYNFLAQSEVLEVLITDKGLKPMVDELIEFDKKFTKQENVDAERAMMDLLFNESVYQAFLLSHGGERVHKFKDFIFRLHDLVKEFSKISGYLKWRGKTSQKRLNLLKKIYKQIKETMHKPTVKAILNWGFDPQEIGADSVLTPKDLELINAYRQRQNTLHNINTSVSAHEHLAEDILEQGRFSSRDIEFIEYGLSDDAPIEDRLQAIAMLDEADRYMTTYDYELSRHRQIMQYYAKTSQELVDKMMAVGGEEEYHKACEEYVRDQLMYLQDLAENDKLSSTLRETISDHLADINKYFQVIADIPGLISDIQYYADEAEAKLSGYTDSRNMGTENGLVQETVNRIKETFVEYGFDENDTRLNEDIIFLLENLGDDGSLVTLQDDVSQIITHLSFYTEPSNLSPAQLAGITEENKKLFKLVTDELEYDLLSKKTGRGAFTIPYHAINHATPDDVHKAQFIADKLEEFAKRYGISAEQMIAGDLTGMSMAQRNVLTEDMEILGVEDNYVNFVIRKLESLLGNDYVVTPLYRQLGREVTHTGDFSIVTNPNFSLLGPDHARLSDRLIDSYKAVKQWFEKNEKKMSRIKNEDTAYRLVEDFYDAAYDIQAHQYSDFLDFLPGNAELFWENLGKMWRKDGAIQALRHIIASKDTVRELFADTERAIGDAALDEWDRNHKNTYVYNFEIVEKIPAEQLLAKTLLDEDVKTRNEIIASVAGIHLSSAEENAMRETLNNWRSSVELMKKLATDLGSDIATADEFIHYIDKNLSRIIPAMKEDFERSGILVDQTTGELIYEEGAPTCVRGELFIKLFGSLEPLSVGVPLDKFIDISQFTSDIRRQLARISVVVKDAGPEAGGYWSASENLIVIDPVKSSDHVDTLVHEVNHALQSIFGLPGGFNSKTANAMPDLLEYIWKHYPRYVAYTFERAGLPISDERLGMDVELNKMPRNMRNILAYCAYMLVQGEVWARAYSHNKSVHGFTEIATTNGNYLLAPDGKTRFKIRYGTSAASVSAASSKVTPEVAESALLVSFRNVLEAREVKQILGRAGNVSRDTYHTTLSRVTNYEMMQKLANPAVPLTTRIRLTINDLILNPNLLSSEILSIIGDDLSEGNVYFRLKEYIETNVEGISIDRTANTHRYVLVDDNAFDDLLNSKTYGKRDSDESTLIEKYKNADDVFLSEFYKKNVVYNELGISPTVRVVVSPDVRTEAIFDKQHRQGVINIRYRQGVTDADFIDELNHEFRHLLQRYNGFELGFTPRFKVSKEMLADVKAHVPEIFKDATCVKWAKAQAKHYNTNWEDEIVRMFTYYLTGGELNAYGFSASLLSAKPTYVMEEAGKPTIFMPWYNDRTGEGRHKTEYIAARADDSPTPKKKGIKIPQVEKKQPKPAKTRYFSNKKAKGTNLEYYTAADLNSLDLDMQNFVIATTGVENKLPPEIVKAIRARKLTRRRFDEWFRKVDVRKVNDFTFKLINRYIFHNDYISSMQELDELTTGHMPAFYWAAAQVLRREGMPLQKLVMENDLNSFMSFMDDLENSKWREKIEEEMKLFSRYQTDVNDKGDPVYEDITPSDDMMRWMRVFAMEYYNGTLGGAFYLGKQFKKTVIKMEFSRRNKTKSADASINDAMSDDKEMSAIERFTDEDNAFGSGNDNVGNDIIAWYEQTAGDTEEMITRISRAKYRQDMIAVISQSEISNEGKATLAKLLSDPDDLAEKLQRLKNKSPLTSKEERLLKLYRYAWKHHKQITEGMLSFVAKLESLSTDELVPRHTEIVNNDIYGGVLDPQIFDLDKELAAPLSQKAKQEEQEAGLSKKRRNIVARIKNSGNIIIKYINQEVITFNDLPAEVQDMFEMVSAVEQSSGRTIKQLQLKQHVYSVGRGRVALPGPTDTSGAYYTPKSSLNDDNSVYRHDVERILENDRILRAVRDAIKEKVKTKKEGEKTAKRTLANMERENKKLRKQLEKATTPKNTGTVHNTDFEVKTVHKKSKISDTPNNFTIISGIPMPEVLRQIFDTSFTKMADTRVQFASRDEQGNLYDKEEMGTKFESRLKHEVSNWDAFYEANRTELLALTRNDVLDIVEFFENGTATLDGHNIANKLKAFEVFLLGYFVDGARRNFSNWNFSAQETEHLEKLFEATASECGSGLNAVAQMQKVIDPLKRVRSRMFDDWISVSEGDKNDLMEAVDKLQKETDPEKARAQAKIVTEMLDEMQRREVASQIKHKPWSKAWLKEVFSWQKIKSWRYLSMLSSPLTWIRSKVSNVIITILNAAADVTARIIFTSKGYRKEQWNLSGVKISPEVKAFIDEYIKDNPVFDPLYEMSGKYDERQRKKIADEHTLFVSLISQAIERKYAAEHRFDSSVMQWVSKFVDARISDKHFIRFITGRYFGKILTIEAQRKHVDLSKGLTDDVLNLFAEAAILGNLDYVHKCSPLADLIDNTREKHPQLYETLSFIFPFMNSSFNWYVECLKFTPVGLINAIIRMTRLEQKITEAEVRRSKGELVADSRVTEYLIRRDIGKGTVGLLLSILGAILAATQVLKLEEEDDKFYIIAGDVKFDISDIFASSSVLIGASVAQVWLRTTDENDDDIPLEERIEFMFTQVVAELLDDFFVNDILERHKWNKGPYDAVLTETESVLRSFVPQIWQLAMRLTNNEEIRYSSGMAGMWERWLNSFVPMQPLGNRKVNPYTGEIETKYALPIVGELLKSGILGPKIFWYEISETERMCRELGVNKNELTGELTVDKKKYVLDREKLNTKYGQLNKESLAKIKSQKHTVEMPDGKFKTLSWDKMSDEQRARVINKVMVQNAEIAKIYIWTQQMGYKFYASDSLWLTLRKLGITRNVYKGDKGFVK